MTGAGRASGIGYEVCRQLFTRGFRVYLSARRFENARARSEQFLMEGGSVVPVGLDVTSEEDVDAAVRTIRDEEGRLDVLINNAALAESYGGSFRAAELDRVRQEFEVILFGAWRLSRAFVPLLQKSEKSRIVNVSSGAGSHDDAVFGLRTGNGVGPGYGTAKASLNALTTVMAEELKPLGIAVNAVCPGFTATFEGGASMGARPVAEGAAGIVWAATVQDPPITGGFFRDGVPLPW